MSLKPFKLDEKTSEMPSEFKIRFIKDDIEYEYGFSCNETKIVKEFLNYKPAGENFKEIFVRDEKSKKRFKFVHDKEKQEQIKELTNENTLYLSKSDQNNYPKTKPVYEFIVNELVINYHPLWEIVTAKKFFEDSEFKNKFIDILKRTDFGGILNLDVKKKKRNIEGYEINVIGKGPSIKQVRNDEEYYDIRMSHETKNGKTVHFEIDEESLGTRKFFSMLGPIFNILETGKILIIDELESSLHPSITHFLIKLFNSKHNKKNGQLIFTTHDTTLLKYNNLFRRDQLYFCSKKPNEQTKLNNFVDFKLREDINFEKAYLDGRVGGLPFIDETFFDENDKEEQR